MKHGFNKHVYFFALTKLKADLLLMYSGKLSKIFVTTIFRSIVEWLSQPSEIGIGPFFLQAGNEADEI